MVHEREIRKIGNFRRLSGTIWDQSVSYFNDLIASATFWNLRCQNEIVVFFIRHSHFKSFKSLTNVLFGADLGCSGNFRSECFETHRNLIGILGNSYVRLLYVLFDPSGSCRKRNESKELYIRPINEQL